MLGAPAPRAGDRSQVAVIPPLGGQEVCQYRCFDVINEGRIQPPGPEALCCGDGTGLFRNAFGQRFRQHAGTGRQRPRQGDLTLYVRRQRAVGGCRVRPGRQNGNVRRYGHGVSPSALPVCGVVLRLPSPSFRVKPLVDTEKGANRPRSVSTQAIRRGSSLQRSRTAGASVPHTLSDLRYAVDPHHTNRHHTAPHEATAAR